MEPDCSLTCSQQPATGTFLGQVNPIHTRSITLEAYPHLRLSLQRGLCPSRSSTTLLHTPLLHACRMYRLFNRPCRKDNEMYNTRPFLKQLLRNSAIISRQQGVEIESLSDYWMFGHYEKQIQSNTETLSDGGKGKCSGKTQNLCHNTYHKSHVDLWHGLLLSYSFKWPECGYHISY
jgi:hypothetical protein